MAETLLREVRNGFYVVGCFYGHPGVFAMPPHRALSIATNEGYEAIMLPGISAEDCLLADLDIDPSRPGCQTLGANDIVLRDRPIATDCHVIIFQVGAVGEQGFEFKGFKKTKFNALAKRLVAIYGSTHPVCHYVASQYTFAAPKKDFYAMEQLLRAETEKKITGISTFYIPPKDLLRATATGARDLGFSIKPGTIASQSAYPPGTPYAPRDLRAVEALKTHKIPKNYKKARMSPDFYDALHQLATQPRVVAKYKANRKAFAARFPDLRPRERRALISGHPGAIRMAAKADISDPAQQFCQAELRNPSLMKQYTSICKKYSSDQNGKAEIAAWLKSQGYDTTQDAIWTAWQTMMNQDISVFQCKYSTWLNGSAAGPDVTIQGGNVYLGGVQIKNYTYSQNTLSWAASQGNASSGTLHFQLLTSNDGKPLPPNSYIGPQFYGIYYLSGQPLPTGSNIYGKVGAPPPGPGPATATPISTWFATYSLYQTDSSGKLQPQGQVTVADAGNGQATITWGSTIIKNPQWNNQNLTWSIANGNPQYASLSFYLNSNATSSNPVAGPQFSGKTWTTDGQVPAKPNVWACKATTSAPKDPDSASKSAFTATYWEMQAVNIGVMVIGMSLGHIAQKLIDAVIKYNENPTPDNLQAKKQAQSDLDNTSEQNDAISDEASSVDESGDTNGPQPDPPQQQEEEQEEQQEEQHEEQQEEQQEEQHEEQQEEQQEEQHEEQQEEQQEEQHEEQQEEFQEEEFTEEFIEEVLIGV